jgi:hypothetical protein
MSRKGVLLMLLTGSRTRTPKNHPTRVYHDPPNCQTSQLNIEIWTNSGTQILFLLLVIKTRESMPLGWKVMHKLRGKMTSEAQRIASR